MTVVVAAVDATEAVGMDGESHHRMVYADWDDDVVDAALAAVERISAGGDADGDAGGEDDGGATE